MMPAAGSGQSSPMMGPSGPPSFQFGQQGQQQTASNSMADSREELELTGRRTRHSVPITRPVRVECRADRLVLQTDQNLCKTQEIPLTERTEDRSKTCPSAVCEPRVDTWGSAGLRHYWCLQLAVDVCRGRSAACRLTNTVDRQRPGSEAGDKSAVQRRGRNARSALGKVVAKSRIEPHKIIIATEKQFSQWDDPHAAKKKPSVTTPFWTSSLTLSAF